MDTLLRPVYQCPFPIRVVASPVSIVVIVVAVLHLVVVAPTSINQKLNQRDCTYHLRCFTSAYLQLSRASIPD